MMWASVIEKAINDSEFWVVDYKSEMRDVQKGKGKVMGRIYLCIFADNNNIDVPRKKVTHVKFV